MKIGDLVRCDAWVRGGLTGIVIHVQDVPYCASALVLLETGVHMIRLENIHLIEEKEP